MWRPTTGPRSPPRPQRYQRAHETIQIVQALWGSWGRDAWLQDTANARFADPEQIRPVNLKGEYVASRGPLPIPPSEQGQPVIFSAGGGEYGREIAGRYASGVIGATYSIEAARAEREAVREAARRAGRDPDDVKYFPGVMPAIAPPCAKRSTGASGSGNTCSRRACPTSAPCSASRSTPPRSTRRSRPSSSPPRGPARSTPARSTPSRSPDRGGRSARSSPTASSTTTRRRSARPP
ncbi:LLM class flavin-dependent oxidoreductase [Agilicoccus flavus]|uniref:LLM class flavin-dependent oxidoreductase n=1 Tax=Agilicoccus flavus TaxID=2775968 RepID=UPI0027DAADBB|nr:LLM class flavin-dependent oxidoreductase [Agilicoccus flavus]